MIFIIRYAFGNDIYHYNTLFRTTLNNYIHKQLIHKYITMTITIILLLIIGVVFIRWYLKALKDPDVIEASNLHMSVSRYRLYKDIYDEQVQCFKVGKNPPEREIPNMNEWRKYGEYMQKKSHDKMRDSIDKLKNRKYENEK